MKTKHTPGPWDARGNTIICAAPSHHMHEYVVLGDTEDAWSDDETKIADARLMAASPDLLEYCKLHNGLDKRERWAIDQVREMAKGGRPYVEVMDQMRNAAIAKAEGND